VCIYKKFISFLIGNTLRIAVYYENRMKRTNKLCGQDRQFYYVKVGGTCSDR
jgi:hypothetical protein